MQAAQTGRTLELVPCGHTVVHLDRIDRATLCTQATARASIRIDAKFARILACGQAKAVVQLGGKHRDGTAHVVSHRAIGNHLRAFSNLLVCPDVNRRHLLCIGKIEHRSPGIRHLHAVLGRRLNASLMQQIGGKARSLPGGSAKRRGGKDIGVGRDLERCTFEKIDSRRGQAPAIRGSDKALTSALFNSDMRIGLAFERLNRDGDIAQMLGDALSNMAAVALGAKVQNHAGPNLPFCSFSIITQENAERTKARPALPCTQDHRS